MVRWRLTKTAHPAGGCILAIWLELTTQLSRRDRDCASHPFIPPQHKFIFLSPPEVCTLGLV